MFLDLHQLVNAFMEANGIALGYNTSSQQSIQLGTGWNDLPNTLNRRFMPQSRTYVRHQNQQLMLSDVTNKTLLALMACTIVCQQLVGDSLLLWRVF
jgi:hypothetical protein